MKSATRIIPASAGALVVLILAIAMLTMISGPASTTINADTLVSRQVASAPVLDGDASDAVWASAPATVAPVSGGVSGVDPMPMGIGDIAGGGSAGFTLQYHVPTGVASFFTAVHATSDDACGNSYSYQVLYVV